VTAHPARAKRRVRAARVFISPEAAGAPIYLYSWGGGWFLKTKSSFSASAKSGLFWLLLVLFLIVFFFLEVTKVLYSRQSRSQRGSRGKQRVVCYDGLECISSVCSYLP
jgi:hypothetical protein